MDVDGKSMPDPCRIDFYLLPIGDVDHFEIWEIEVIFYRTHWGPF